MNMSSDGLCKGDSRGGVLGGKRTNLKICMLLYTQNYTYSIWISDDV